MNKEELEKEIQKTKEQLTKLQQALKDKEYERYKPQNNEEYFCINAFNDVNTRVFDTDNPLDEKLLSILNCFQTKEQAEQEAEKILIRRQLEDIAKRLNKGEKIDYTSYIQSKYYIFWNYEMDKIRQSALSWTKTQGVVYCLDENFKNIAIEEIGEERLKRYLKGE